MHRLCIPTGKEQRRVEIAVMLLDAGTDVNWLSNTGDGCLRVSAT